MRRKVWSGRDVVFGSVSDGIDLRLGGEATDLFGGEANAGRIGGGESLGGYLSGGESVSQRIDGGEAVPIRHFGGESVNLSGGESVGIRSNFGGESVQRAGV